MPATSAVPPPTEGLKGLLIILIIAGHLLSLRHEARPIFDLLYSFHVGVFLLLPFMLPQRRLTGDFAATRAVRYLVPFAAFTLLAWLANGLIMRQGQLDFTALATALVWPNAYTLNTATDLRALWFLPALFTLVLILGLWQRLRTGGRALLLAAALAVNLGAGLLPELQRQIPWGVNLALWLLPVGLLAAALWPVAQRVQTVWPLYLSALLALALVIPAGLVVDLGNLTFAGLNTPGLWLLHNLILVCVPLALLRLAPWLERQGLLRVLGRHSLAVYLLHPLLYQGLLLATGRMPLAAELLLVLPLLTMVTLMVALLLSRLAMPRRLLFPRDGADFLAGLGLLRQGRWLRWEGAR